MKTSMMTAKFEAFTEYIERVKAENPKMKVINDLGTAYEKNIKGTVKVIK